MSKWGSGDVGVHLHNTRNTGYVNAVAALDSGATILDASVGGLGGCPYAPRATGNIATEDLVFLLEGEGVASGIDLDALVAVSEWLEGVLRLGGSPPATVYRAGSWPPRAGLVNRLAQETSPYLLQHAGNPVDWYAWGDEAFARARAEDRPILLSVGYAACHWCHVMAHESFEDPETAALMNELFVNVKVDREERPDVDSLYMDVVVALTGSGGWPMTVFLTPEGEPFLGGTYFPPEPRHGLPELSAGAEVRGGHLSRAARRRRSPGEGANRSPFARRLASRPRASRLTDSLLHEAVRGLRSGFDERHGGWGRAPKFPQASDDRVPAASRRARARDEDARRDGARRDVRPARRRVPSLLGRRALARPALREDALRQRAARPGLPSRLARDRQDALPRDRRGDGDLPAARARAPGRRLRVGAGRRHERRRRPDVHLDAGRRRAGGAPRALRARPEHPPRRPAARAEGGAARAS